MSLSCMFSHKLQEIQQVFAESPILKALYGLSALKAHVMNDKQKHNYVKDSGFSQTGKLPFKSFDMNVSSCSKASLEPFSLGTLSGLLMYDFNI